MTGCSCLARLRSQTHRDKLTDTSSKLKHDSTQFSQKQAENSQTLKGNRQLSQATHCQMKKHNIIRHIIQNRPLSGFDAQQHELRIAVSFTTIVQSRPKSPFKGSPTVSSVTVPCTCQDLWRGLNQAACQNVFLRVVPCTTSVAQRRQV